MKFHSIRFASALAILAIPTTAIVAMSTTALAQTPLLATSGCAKPAMPDATKKAIEASAPRPQRGY